MAVTVNGAGTCPCKGQPSHPMLMSCSNSAFKTDASKCHDCQFDCDCDCTCLRRSPYHPVMHPSAAAYQSAGSVPSQAPNPDMSAPMGMPVMGVQVCTYLHMPRACMCVAGHVKNAEAVTEHPVAIYACPSACYPVAAGFVTNSMQSHVNSTTKLTWLFVPLMPDVGQRAKHVGPSNRWTRQRPAQRPHENARERDLDGANAGPGRGWPIGEDRPAPL
eukprot:365157-Chlamydomonas_euryale.AAC.28